MGVIIVTMMLILSIYSVLIPTMFFVIFSVELIPRLLVGIGFILPTLMLMILLFHTMVVSIIALIMMKIIKKNQDKLQSLRCGMLYMKMGIIPLYITNFILFQIMATSLGIRTGVGGPIFYLFGVGLTCYIAIMTGAYATSILCLYYREELFASHKLGILCATQFIIGVDVIGALFIYKNIKDNYQQNNVLTSSNR